MIQYNKIQGDIEVQGKPSSDYINMERTGWGQRTTKR